MKLYQQTDDAVVYVDHGPLGGGGDRRLLHIDWPLGRCTCLRARNDRRGHIDVALEELLSSLDIFTKLAIDFVRLNQICEELYAALPKHNSWKTTTVF